VRREKEALQKQIDKEHASLSKLSSLKTPSPKPEAISEVDEEEEEGEEEQELPDDGVETKTSE
jgi:hypothetical protein